MVTGMDSPDNSSASPAFSVQVVFFESAKEATVVRCVPNGNGRCNKISVPLMVVANTDPETEKLSDNRFASVDSGKPGSVVPSAAQANRSIASNALVVILLNCFFRQLEILATVKIRDFCYSQTGGGRENLLCRSAVVINPCWRRTPTRA